MTFRFKKTPTDLYHDTILVDINHEGSKYLLQYKDANLYYAYDIKDLKDPVSMDVRIEDILRWIDPHTGGYKLQEKNVV